MIDIFLSIIQAGIILNIFSIIVVTITLLITLLKLKKNDEREYNRIIEYSKSLKRVSRWQDVANILIPFYGVILYNKALNVVLSEEYYSEYVKFKFMEDEVDKLRIFKRQK